MKPLPCIFILCLLMGLSACTQKKAPDAKNPEPTPAEIKPEAKPVTLKVAKLGEVKEAIKAQQGKIVVVDIWATWCIPCMEEFPNLVKLHDKYHDKNVVCMSVSVDAPESKEAALKFLQKQHASIPNFLLDDEKKEWQDYWDIGPIPAVMVYDATGKVHGFRGGDPDKKRFTYADVEAQVQKLLKK